MCARTCACARARVAVVRERSRRGKGGGTGVGSLARSFSSPRPRTRVWLCRWRLTADGGSLSSSRSPPSTPAACLTAPRAARGCCPLFPVRLFRVPFRSVSWGVVRVRFPRRGKGERPASASRPPSRRGSRARVAGRSRCRARVARTGASSRRRSSLPRLPAPRPLSGYLATAFRRVGLKTPRGGRLSVPGVGGAEGPVGSRRRPAAPADSRSSGFGSPLSGARGARLRVPGSPVRRRSRAPCLSVPTRFPSFFPCLAGRPEANPSPRGPCRRQLLSERKNARTTLSGGSLGSCVDEERS